MTKRAPVRCYGNEQRVVHAPACRPGRPLCRFMRRVKPSQRVCRCDVFHFPHRAGSCRGFHGMPAVLWRALGRHEAQEHVDRGGYP